MSRIWVPKFKILEPKSELGLTIGIAGKYRLQVRGPDGRVRRDTGWFPNLILNNGLDQIGNDANQYNACQVGTGSTAPDAGDTGLVGYLAGTTDRDSSVMNDGSSPYVHYRTNIYHFAQGAAQGNLAEVAVAGTSTTGNLFSRALILDSMGSPTTLTVASDEFLDVTYQLQFHPPLVDNLDTISISASSYDTTRRASLITNAAWEPDAFRNESDVPTVTSSHTAYSGALGPVTGAPSTSIGDVGSVTNQSYSNGNYYRDYELVFGLNDVTASIQSIQTRQGVGGYLQYDFDPVIPKTDENVLTLNFRQTWAVGTPV